MKTDLIFEIPAIENPRFDISHYLLLYIGLSPPAMPPPSSAGDALVGVWGYPKRKNELIFEFPTI